MIRRVAAVAFLASFLVLGVVAGCKKTQPGTFTVEPARGSMEGGYKVSIKGSGFQQGGTHSFKIYFGQAQAGTPVVMSDSELVVDVPPGPKGKSVDVTIIFDNAQTYKIPNAFTYVDMTPQ